MGERRGALGAAAIPLVASLTLDKRSSKNSQYRYGLDACVRKLVIIISELPVSQMK